MLFESIDRTIGVVGLMIGVLSLAYAFYQGSEKKKLRRYVNSQNWHLYSKSNNANGQLQQAILSYKSDHASALIPHVLASLEKADAFEQDVFKEIVRQIQLSEKRFDKGTVDRWINEGRITDTHAKALFRTLLP